MKNLIVALSLFFVIGAVAQTKKPLKTPIKKIEVQKAPETPEIGALKNISDLEQFMPLKPEMREMLQQLFQTKYYMLKDAGDSAERKSIVAQSITAKLQSTVDNATFNKIKANKVLFESLIN